MADVFSNNIKWILIIVIIASVVVSVCLLTLPPCTRLKNIENKAILSASQEAVVWIPDGETYHSIGTINKDLLKALSNIKISQKEISSDRSDNRDKRYTLVMQLRKVTEPTIYAYLKELHIHFSSDFTSVWVKDGINPTYSYQIKNPSKAKRIYEAIANCTDPEKPTWTYTPILSYTGHSYKAFIFDFDYTHVEGTCTEGTFCALDAATQPSSTKMRFERGSTVYWTPDEVVEKVSRYSEVTLAIYNNEMLLHTCTIVFEGIFRDVDSVEFEIYLKDADGLAIVTYDEDLKLIKPKFKCQ